MFAEGVFEVFDLGFGVGGVDDGDDVVAVVAVGVVFAGDVSFGGFADVGAFFGADAVFGSDGVGGFAGADFDEDGGVTGGGDDVYFVFAEDDVSVEDAVAFVAQVSHGEVFALLSQCTGGLFVASGLCGGSKDTYKTEVFNPRPALRPGATESASYFLPYPHGLPRKGGAVRCCLRQF